MNVIEKDFYIHQRLSKTFRIKEIDPLYIKFAFVLVHLSLRQLAQLFATDVRDSVH